MKNKLFLIIIIIFAINNFAKAQCNSNSINEADKEYLIGNFNDVITMLSPCIKDGFTDVQKIQAYRILSKTYIALDNDSDATKAAEKLLEIKPDFQTDNLTDPIKFIEIIERLKNFGNQLLVTSVSKKAENILEAPATVVSISQKEFSQKGYQDFEQMMYDLPGFDISRSNGNMYSHIYQRGYRSINTNRTLFLIDGVEDNDLWSSNVYLSRQFPVTNLKTVEIVYGPASTMYGSNAFLGVINIITKDPSDIIKAGKNYGVSAIAGYGSYNTKFFDGTVAVQSKNKQVALSVTGRVFLSDEQNLDNLEGYSFKPREYNDSIATIYHKSLDITDSTKAAKFISTYGAKSDFYTYSNNKVILTETGIQKALELDNTVYSSIVPSDFADNKSIYVKLKFYDIMLGWMAWETHEGAGAQYNDTEYMTANQGYSWAPVHNSMYAKYEKNIHENLQISNFMQFKLHDFAEDNRIVRFRDYRYSAIRKYKLENLMAEDMPRLDTTYLFQKSNQFRNELKVLYVPFNKLDILAGFEARYSVLQGDYTTNTTGNTEETGTSLSNTSGGNNYFVRDLGLYTQATYKMLNTLKLTAGVRYDNNVIRNTGGYGDVYNPRFAIVFFPQKFIFKVIYAEAFKDATNREKFSTIAGKRELINPELKPERVKNIEASVGHTFFDNNLNINIVGYYARYSNIIQEVSVKTVINGKEVITNQNQGIGKQKVYGINGFLDYKVDNFILYANYTYTLPWIIDPVDSNNKPYINADSTVIHKLRISDISTNQANIGINYFYKKMLDFNFRVNYVGKKIVGENTTVTTNIFTFEPRFLLCGAVTYTNNKSGMSLQLNINNILNQLYYTPGLDNATGVLAGRLPQNRINFQLKLIFEI